MKHNLGLVISLLIALLVVPQVSATSEYVLVGYDEPEFQNACPTPGYSGLRVSERVRDGEVIECVYECQFTTTDMHGMGTPRNIPNNVFTLDPDDTLEDRQVQRECCGESSLSTMCFLNGQCYYHPDPSSCAAGEHEPDRDCDPCTIKYYNLQGELEDEEEVTACNLCEIYQERCIDGYELVSSSDGVVECQKDISDFSLDCECPQQEIPGGEEFECTVMAGDEVVETVSHISDPQGSFLHEVQGRDVMCEFNHRPPADFSCECPDDEFSEGSSVECNILENGQRVDIATHVHRGPSSFIHRHENQNIECRYDAAEPEPGDLRCSCTVIDGRRFRCNIYDDKRIDEMFVNFNERYGETIRETYTHDDGRTVDCIMDVPIGCGITEDQVGDGVCYSGCRSWEDPDCDYGRAGREALEYVFRGIEIGLERGLEMVGIDVDIRVSPQYWWNRALEDTPLANLYSALDNMPGTPEWFTSQVCRANLDLGDSAACELVGLPEEECLGQTEWEGAALFADGPAISIGARRTEDDGTWNYVLRWFINGASGSQIQVFLTDIDDREALFDYSKLTSDRTQIYPEEGEFGQASSSMYEYKTSREHDHMCLVFRASGNKEQELMELLDTEGKPFVCRPIAG